MNSRELSYYYSIESLMKTSRYITEQVSLLLKPFGITEAQYNVLRILEDSKSKPLTIQEIQTEMYHTSSNVSRIIDKLVVKNLVKREIRPSNRRKMDITLSNEGLKSIKNYNGIIQGFHQPQLNRLTEDETTQLYHLITKLNGGTDEKNQDNSR